MAEKKKKKGELLSRFLPYYKKYKWILVLDLLCASLTTVVEIVLPLIAREITGRAETDVASLTPKFILTCGLIYLVLRLIDTAAYYYMASTGHIMGTKIETDMRRDFFTHLQKLSFSYYDNTKIGTLMSRITSDLFDVTEFAHHCPEEFFIAGIKIIASFAILCTINVPLTLLIFAIVPVMIICMTRFRKKMKEGFKESRRIVGELNSQVEDSLLGIHEVKSFANEDTEIKKFEKSNSSFLSVKKKVYKYMGAFQSSTRFFDGALYIIVVVAGAFFLADSKISSADFIAFMLFASMLLTSIRRLVEFTEQFQRGMTGIERFCEIMDIDPDIEDSEGAENIENVKGDITFEDLTFRYSGTDKNVLCKLNLHVKAGESVALVGPSGGGKTTLCALIPRFYEANDGRILIDGKEIKNITQKSLREHIGIVQQDVYLFSGSVRENIAYGKPDCTEAEIIEAAKLAGAHDFILTLPDGYDTYVGERGVKLSGGQKQRISIARVFLKNPQILILDEATSALDNESEYLIQQSLEKLAKGRTTFTVAHRLTTIKNADRILVLTEKGIGESGTHKELIEKGGLYADLYKMYSFTE
ncbi:MAG: ABC transporter ATP-binding protein [Clostridia bacterium]|nr:ABC transporter ATP-binding protein [Clostridia bacterium]